MKVQHVWKFLDQGFGTKANTHNSQSVYHLLSSELETLKKMNCQSNTVYKHTQIPFTAIMF